MLTAESKAGASFLEMVGQANEQTARTYKQYIGAFDEFCIQKYGISTDQVIENINKGAKPTVYEVLASFMAYVKNERKVSANTLRFFVKTIRNFLEFHDVAINKVQFKLKVRLPRRINKEKMAIDKENVRAILNACSDIRTKSYLMFLAATGARATEGLSVRLKDLDLKSEQATVSIRGEFTKTRQDRRVFLTKELREQLATWLDYKYREYRSCYYDKRGKSRSERVKPVRRPTDLVFAVYHKDGSNPKLLHMYQDMRDAMQVALSNAGLLEYEDGEAKRMKITLHTFRRFVKSTISDLGYQDYSEYFIGHAGSTYYRKTDKEKVELFGKIEPYLTFLDFSGLEARGADMQSKVDELTERLRKNEEKYDGLLQNVVHYESEQKIYEKFGIKGAATAEKDHFWQWLKELLAEREGKKAATPAGQGPQ